MSFTLRASIAVAILALFAPLFLRSDPAGSPLHFTPQHIAFHVENDESPQRHAPETMAGGVAIFDYNGDGKPDIFFTNGANLRTLKKDSLHHRNRLFRNDGNGHFTDITEQAGLAGHGYDIGVAVADYDNDGWPDIFIAGVHGNSLYHNNGDGTFTDVTAKTGLNKPDPKYGLPWSVGAVWVDVNNDGLLDLFVVNYLQWSFDKEPVCATAGVADYCSPKLYSGLPNELFLNKGNGVFEDVSESSGIRDHIGKGMSGVMADYDGDGLPDLFVPCDKVFNLLFHNKGNGKFEEVAFDTGVAATENGEFISGMGADFRDMNNDGKPDIAFTALNGESFPLFRNLGAGHFEDVTNSSGMRGLSRPLAGFGLGMFDFDNDGWKDLFVACGQVEALVHQGSPVAQPNIVFRNPGKQGRWNIAEDAGFSALPAARHRGVAFGDLNGDGRIDAVVSALDADGEIWINDSANSNHWMEMALRGAKSNRDAIGARIKLVTQAGEQYNHITTSIGYASSSSGPVHFGLGAASKADLIEIRWPSGTLQRLTNVRADQLVKVVEPR